MNEWLSVMDELNEVPDYSIPQEDRNEASFCVRCATYCSFGLNFMLLCGKALAMSTSASYTIMSSLTDSCLDIIGGFIISCTAANSRFTPEDQMKYPVGKSRVSTVGILVFSVLMSCCAIYIILACVNSLVMHELAPPTTPTAVFVMWMTIFVKFCMWIVYAWIGHPITLTLAEDHRNDVLTNSLGLFMYWGGARLRWWMDSTGGILLSLFVLTSWARNAIENSKMLMGQAAPPDIIRNVTYVAAHHHPLIKAVDRVVAYQLGPMYFAEVYIILRDGISLEAARWVGDSLAMRLSRIGDIEHAYVHLDTPSHDPALERLLEQGAKSGLKYSRDQRGQIVFEIVRDEDI
jgi:divalent metal cation (Fe/Co/Zn/Cd) transporter